MTRLFMTIGLAMTGAIWALYISSFGFNDTSVGLLTAGFILCSLLGALASPTLFKVFSLRHIIAATLLISIAAYTIMGTNHRLAIFILLAALTSATDITRMNAFNILFRDNVKNNELNRAEGLLFTLLNIAWFISPLITGALLHIYRMQSIFLFSAAFFALGLALFLMVKTKETAKMRSQEGIISNIRGYFKDKRLRQPYLISIGMQAWWSFIYIYVPLFLLKEGLPESSISIFIGVITLPLIINEYAVGKLSEEQPFKRLFAIGFFGLAVISIAAFMTTKTHTHLFLFTFASFFAAYIEPLQDTFFFRRASQEQEDDFYPVFSTSIEVGSIAARTATAGILLIFPPQGAYLFIAGIMALIGLSATRIRE